MSNEELVDPVRGLVDAFRKGVVTVQRICKTASHGSQNQIIDTLAPAQALGASLAQSESRIRETYHQSSRAFGRRYAEAIINDTLTIARLQALTINLLDGVMNLNDYMDDPEYFDLGSFIYLKRESERCCNQALDALATLCRHLSEAGLRKPRMPSVDEHAPLAPIAQGPALNTISTSNSPTSVYSAPGVHNSVLPPPVPTKNDQRDIPITSSAGLSNPLSSRAPSVHSGKAWSEPKPLPLSDAGHGWSRNASLSGHSLDSKVRESSLSNSLKHDELSESFHPGRKITITRKAIGQDQSSTKLIESSLVARQLNENEELLEKRRRNRLSFQQDLEKINKKSSSLHTSSSSNAKPESFRDLFFSIEPTSTPNPEIQAPVPKANSHEEQPWESPILPIHTNMRVGKVEIPMMIGSTRTRGSTIGSTTGSSYSEYPEAAESSSIGKRTFSNEYPGEQFRTHEPEQMMFGPPESPALSEGRHPESENWGALAQMMKLPPFDAGGVDGLEVVPPLVEDGIEVFHKPMGDSEKMLTHEELRQEQQEQEEQWQGELWQGEQGQPTPASSVRSLEYLMRHDASFYKYGGFCGGAKMTLRGQEGPMKILKKPAGQYTAAVSMKCIKCFYEVGWEQYEKDSALDRSGIYNAGDIRFRQKFLTKSHLHTKSVGIPAYACIFCIEEGKTPEDHDATVFFSALQFFRHLERHPRPLRTVEGIKILYGFLPDAVDFDLHFKNETPKPNPFAGLEARFATQPVGFALVNHRERTKGFRDVDPDLKKTLQFAIGARIVGIVYPPRFQGIWALGYHDGVRAHFPSFAMQLDQPPKDDVVMNPKSTLTAKARWDHKPKDSNSGWLSFSKKDTITHVGFPYQDMWCWTGQNSKGNWGLFPACFVENLAEEPQVTPDPGVNPLGRAISVGGGVSSVSSLGRGNSFIRGHGFGSMIRSPNISFSSPSFLSRKGTAGSSASIRSFGRSGSSG